MVIGIDFDGVLNNMLETWLEWLNRSCVTNKHTIEDITDWELAKLYPELDENVLFEPLNTPEFWDEVAIMPDAEAVVKKLISDGHMIYVVTSSHYKTLPYKLKRCLFAHFPYLTKENVIVTYNKALIRCDLLLDDAEHNLVDFTGVRVIFDAPYNKNATAVDYRVASFKEFYLLVTELTLSERQLRPPFGRIQQFKAGRGQGKTAWLHQMIYDTVSFKTAVNEVPCYVIIPESRYEYFCKSYLDRYGKVCPAILYNEKQHIEPDARIFVDMPSTFNVSSDLFAAFVKVFTSRQNLTFVADFDNTYWHTVIR